MRCSPIGAHMNNITEKGGGSFQGIKLLTEELAARLSSMGVRTYPTETYFFLADFAPHDAAQLASGLAKLNILVKPLNDSTLGPGFMRVTTALPEDNKQFIGALRELLLNAPAQ